jgi:cell wall-associated NlpC family hydrolase
MIADWAYRYVGLDYAEGAWGPDRYDCWGLLALIYRDLYNVDVIDLVDCYHTDRDKIHLLPRVLRCWEPVEEPRVGDGILFLIGGRVPHCGVYVGDSKMVHSVRGPSSCIQSIQDNKWKSRFEGYYRYVQSTS